MSRPCQRHLSALGRLTIIDKQIQSDYAEVEYYRSEAFPAISFNTGASYVNQSTKAQALQSSGPAGLFDRIDGYAFNWGLSLQQPLITFGKVGKALKLAKLREQTLEDTRRLQKDLFFLSLIAQYAEAFTSQHDEEITSSAASRSQRLLSRMKSDFEAGRISRSDFLQIEALCQSDRAQLMAARHSRKTALMRLAVLSGFDSLSTCKLVMDEQGVLSRIPPGNERLNREIALKSMEVEMYEQQRKYIRAGALPSLYLTGSITNQFMTIDTSGMIDSTTLLAVQSQNPSFSAEDFGKINPKPEKYFDKDFFNYSIGVQLNWNIFDGRRTWAQFRQASLNADKARLELENLREENSIAIEESKNRCTTLDSMIVAVSLQNEASQKVFELIEDDYNDGMADITDYLDADQKYRTTVKQLDQLKLQRILSGAQLRIDMGLPIFEE